MLDTFIIIACAALLIVGGLVDRYAPTYVRNRSRRYVHPKSCRKGVKR